MPFALVELAFLKPSITNALSPGIVVSPSLSHFGVRWLGTIATATNGLPPEATYKLAREIRVFPVPHSATTAAERASASRRTIPPMAIAWAGYGLRRRFLSNGEGRSCAPCKGGNE